MRRQRHRQVVLAVPVRWTSQRARHFSALLDEIRMLVARELGIATHSIARLRVTVILPSTTRRRMAIVQVNAFLKQ